MNLSGAINKAEKEWETRPHASCIECQAEFTVQTETGDIPEHPEMCKIIQVK